MPFWYWLVPYEVTSVPVAACTIHTHYPHAHTEKWWLPRFGFTVSRKSDLFVASMEHSAVTKLAIIGTNKLSFPHYNCNICMSLTILHITRFNCRYLPRQTWSEKLELKTITKSRHMQRPSLPICMLNTSD